MFIETNSVLRGLTRRHTLPSPREFMSDPRGSEEQCVKWLTNQRLLKMHSEETQASTCQLAAGTAYTVGFKGSFCEAFSNALIAQPTTVSEEKALR